MLTVVCSRQRRVDQDDERDEGNEETPTKPTAHTKSPWQFGQSAKETDYAAESTDYSTQTRQHYLSPSKLHSSSFYTDAPVLVHRRHLVEINAALRPTSNQPRHQRGTPSRRRIHAVDRSREVLVSGVERCADHDGTSRSNEAQEGGQQRVLDEVLAVILTYQSSDYVLHDPVLLCVAERVDHSANDFYNLNSTTTNSDVQSLANAKSKPAVTQTTPAATRGLFWQSTCQARASLRRGGFPGNAGLMLAGGASASESE